MNANELTIKEIREKLKLTQQELADKVGLTRKTINSYENKGNIPDSKRLLFQMIMSKKFTHGEMEEPEINYSTKKEDTIPRLSEQELKELAYKVAINEDALMKIKLFSNIIEVRVAKKVQQIMSNDEEYKKWRNS